MRVYKPTRKGKRGATVPYARWYVELRDHMEKVRRIPGYTERAATEDLGRRLARLVSLRSLGEPPDPATARWVESLPPSLRDTLARIGLLVGSAPGPWPV